MEMIPVVVLVVLGIPIVLAVWLIVRAVQARGRIEELSFRLSELEAEVIRLKQEPAKPSEPAPKPMPAPVAATIKVAEVPPIPPVPKPSRRTQARCSATTAAHRCAAACIRSAHAAKAGSRRLRAQPLPPSIGNSSWA